MYGQYGRSAGVTVLDRLVDIVLLDIYCLAYRRRGGGGGAGSIVPPKILDIFEWCWQNFFCGFGAWAPPLRHIRA